MTPPRPNRVDAFPLGDLCDQRHVGVVVLVRTTRDLDVVIRETNKLGVRREVLRGRHGQELNRVFIPKRVERPTPHRQNALRRRHTVIRDQHLTNHPFPSSFSHILGQRIRARRRSRARRRIRHGFARLRVAALCRARHDDASRRVRPSHARARRRPPLHVTQNYARPHEFAPSSVFLSSRTRPRPRFHPLHLIE